MLGEGNREKGKEIREKYSNFENVDNSYKQLEEYWADKMSRLQINITKRRHEYHD